MVFNKFKILCNFIIINSIIIIIELELVYKTIIFIFMIYPQSL